MFLETKLNNENIKIVIVGVGGGGGNAVNRMIEDQIQGVEYIVANTDYQALQHSLAENKIQLGEKLTKGLGAGAKPEIGKKAAEESYDIIKEELTGAQMVFVAAGMGGGTGTGASPIVAKIAKELGALTIGIVTTPFEFEGSKKRRMSDEGLEELQKNVDSMIVIPNDKIFEICPKGTTFDEALKKGNEVLKKGVQSITDIIKVEGIINVDFADVRTVMTNAGGVCHMGFGKAKGENRALEAVKLATISPLLDTSIRYAKNVLVNITASEGNLSHNDVKTIGDYIKEFIGEDDNFEIDNYIPGSAYSDELGEDISVVIIATGMEEFNDDFDFDMEDIETKISSNTKNTVDKSFVSADTHDLDIDNDIDNEESKIQDISEITKRERKNNSELNIPSFLKNIGRK